MDNKRFTFSKKEKLCSRKVISALFDHGRSFYSGPFRVVWMKSSEPLPCPAQLAISIGKKTMPRAVKRNRVKRLVREAWRMNKHQLYTRLGEMNSHLYIMLIYTAKEIPGYAAMEREVDKLVGNFSLHLNAGTQNK